uniref:Selenoprotein Pb-like n=2 Tax=Hippocampus comes TaxID=109280 RepID=A0A3Q2Y6P2_HIPCM
MIINERDSLSRAMYWELKRKAPADVPVYQQTPFQNDVWEALEGDKDDFLIYDRCGLLTFHIVLPYSFLHYPYVEAAIRATNYKNICNCSANFTTVNDIVTKNDTLPSDVNHTTASPKNQANTEHAEMTVTTPKTIHTDHHHHHHLPHGHQNRSHPQQDHNTTGSLSHLH